MFNGDKTYDNWTGEIQLSKELLIETEPQGHRDTYAIRVESREYL